MTHKEFDAIRLPRKLTFIEAESARRVLVLGESKKSAAALYGLGDVKLNEILKLFNEAIEKGDR